MMKDNGQGRGFILPMSISLDFVSQAGEQVCPGLMLKRGFFILFIGFLLAACDSTRTDEAGPVEVTLLLAYTSSVRASTENIETRLIEAVAETNETFRNSAIDLELTAVHQEEIAYRVGDRLQDLERLLLKQDGHLDAVHTLRDVHEADIVVLVVNSRASTINAAVMAEEKTAFAIVHWEHVGAPDYGMAHEIGHLFGARHTPDSDPLSEPFVYGHGYRNDSLRTIMANGPQLRVPFYSGPDQVFEGVVLGDSTVQNVARLLRESAIYISNFRGEQQATDFEPLGTWPVLVLED